MIKQYHTRGSAVVLNISTAVIRLQAWGCRQSAKNNYSRADIQYNISWCSENLLDCLDLMMQKILIQFSIQFNSVLFI